MGTEYIIWWVGYYGMMSFLPVLDAVLSELERQFSPKVLCTIMRAIQACTPGSPHLFGSPSIILLLLLILMASIKVLFPWSVP